MNVKKLSLSAGACAAGFMILGGCQASVSGGVETTSSNATAVVVSNDDAVVSITKARCEREVACNNVGAGKKWDSTGACVREIEHDTGITLRPEKCEKGILSDRLDSCLNEIRTQRCDNPIDAMERVAACRKGMICK